MSEPLDSRSHYRRSIRLKAYDYTGTGGYFVTICTHNRECLFGEVTGGEMRLSAYGEIARDEWVKTAAVRQSVTLDAFVVMPNHIRGIIILGDVVGATWWVALPGQQVSHANRPTGPQSTSLGAIIGQFKSMVTKRINERRGIPGLPVWQRNYHEHIIRGGELEHLREQGKGRRTASPLHRRA
jgi:REP element-mobilizing transposase RayT